MKNHEWVDGKLLQTNKKYSHLKQKQKERIYQWMYDAYKSAYKKSGKYPDDKEDDQIGWQKNCGRIRNTRSIFNR